MKKFNLGVLATVAALALSPAAMAKDHVPGGGFTGPSAINASTVEAAKNMSDDTHITLIGNIEQHLGGDKYLFKDKTGTIKVEIDHDKWNGQNVSPADKVEIRGEVDKGWTSVKIDVDEVRIVK